MKFKPTAQQITAAEDLMFAVAHEQMVRPIVESYQKEILERHQFKNIHEPFNVITQPKHSYLMSDADGAIYCAESEKAMTAAGLKVHIPDGCPLLIAEEQVRQKRRALLQSLESIPALKGLSLASGLGLDDQAIDLSMRMLAPFCRTADAILQRQLAEATVAGEPAVAAVEVESEFSLSPSGM